MIIFAVNSFLSPYKNMSINILECLLCTILIFIILLRNTVNILEELLVLVTDSNEQIVDGSCDSDSSGVTRLTVLLTPFYYLLLVVPVCYCMVKFPWRQLWLVASYNIQIVSCTEYSHYYLTGITVRISLRDSDCKKVQ